MKTCRETVPFKLPFAWTIVHSEGADSCRQFLPTGNNIMYIPWLRIYIKVPPTERKATLCQWREYILRGEGGISSSVPRKCSPLSQIRREQKMPGPLLLVYFMFGTIQFRESRCVPVIWITFCISLKTVCIWYSEYMIQGTSVRPFQIHKYATYTVQKATILFSFLKKINSKSPGPITEAKSILRYICWDWNYKLYSVQQGCIDFKNLMV